MKRILLFTMAWMSCFLSQAQLSVYYAIPAPTGNWTNYVIPLTETAGWTMGSPGGSAPDASHFLGILGSLDGLSIRFNSNAQLFFDNISLANLASSTFPNCSTDGWIIGDNRGPLAIHLSAILPVQSTMAPFLPFSMLPRSILATRRLLTEAI